MPAIFCSIVLFLAAAGVEDTAILRPVDEAATRPDFAVFRTRLMTALKQRDKATVLDIVHPQIKSSFGGDDGIERFKQFWRIDAADSKVWKELETVLKLGGSFDGSADFTAPYTFSRWPSDMDAFEYVAVIGSNVRLRAEPRPNATIVKTVSFSILKLHKEAVQNDWKQQEWTAVDVSGRKVYVATRLVRSPVDYRARFTFADGRWRMTVFVAGD